MKDEDRVKNQPLNESQASNEIPGLHTEQVKMVYKAAPIGMVAALLNSAILTFILWNVISYKVLITWFLCNLLITSMHYVFVFWYRHTSVESKKVTRWSTWFILGLVLNGLVWGAAGIFLFPAESMTHQVFLAFSLAGMAIGLVEVYSVVPKASLAYTGLVLIPITTRLFVQGGNIPTAMGIMMLLLMTLVLIAVRSLHIGIITSLKLGFEKRDLITYLTTAKEHAEKLNEKLQFEIAEHKQTEGQLRESETRFRDLVENALTGIYIIQQGQIVYKNPEQDRIFGPLSRPFNFNNFETIHPEDLEKVKESFEKIASGGIQNFDIYMRFFPAGKMDDGMDMKWVHCQGNTIKFQGQEAILVNMMDLTRTRELEHLVRIDDKMTSLGRVAAGIIHELRNPLSGINVYLNTLKKIYNAPESLRMENLERVEKIIEKLQSASHKIESVIKRVMDFSKPSVPKLTLTDVNQPIEEAINLSLVTLRKRGIKIEKSLHEDLPWCYTDPYLIEQALLNLITNAAEAMENMDGEKNIEITSSAEGNSIFIAVADSGPGIPPALRKKIFDPFFTTKKDSSGIGLSVCHRIIADHGGSLDVFSSKWGGAEFRIEIPIEKRKGTR